MFGLNGFINSRLDSFSYNRLSRSAFTSNNSSTPFPDFSSLLDKPKWLAMATPQDFEAAIRFNPVVKAPLNLLAKSGSNGIKYLVDAVSGEEIPWTDKREIVQKLYNLIVLRPNPLQTAREFQFQGVFYLKGYGNRFIHTLMPSGFNKKLNIMNVTTLYNLPSQFMEVRTTGKLYSQHELSGIISEYARTNTNPVEKYTPENVIHFNEVNVSSEEASVLGISKLEVLKQPITNTQSCFEAMNSILTARGMQGILSINVKDGQGANIPTKPQQEAVKDKFKNDYGLLSGQNPFLLSPIPLDYIKTVMNSKELGIYEEFTSNSAMISNEFGVHPALTKTYITGETYANQSQYVKSLYQDTTIPMINDEDDNFNYKFNLRDHGVLLKTKWDHIPALQVDFKEKATSISLKGRTAKEAYIENVITVNQYLTFIEQPTITEGDVYKFEWDVNKKPIENEE